ncbi:hypothetical protein [Pseudooctadecabacter jejudonensis]|uniref:Succinate dehydrogenase n=1 Tax=Pseudooctadecabacter jejudonensis TaxID=1391910 RepID=A0A1Y5RZB6_9RHOB|nr:hypothetical protein [Pseudooctadecabacter jejudonensis]SLN26393.1 hypothetical protein PSJ8397_01054 [Pseudooctadecabacter jejudonensis]
MTKSFAFLAAAALTLSACDMVEIAAVDTGRDAARAVVAPIVADTVPGPAGQVLTNCIIDNATGDELLVLAAQGASADNITLVSNILARPATVTCATSGLT